MHASIMSGAISLSGELPSSACCVDGSGSVSAKEVDASKSSTGNRLANGATDVDVIAEGPGAPSVITHVADAACVSASKGRYVVVSGMNSLPGEASFGSSGCSSSVPAGKVVPGVDGVVHVSSGHVHVLDRSGSTRDRTGGTSGMVEKTPSVGGGTARGPERQQRLSPLY